MNFKTVTEYAKENDVTPQYIRKLIRQGKIEAYRFNGCKTWFIAEEENKNNDRNNDEKFLKAVRKQGG